MTNQARVFITLRPTEPIWPGSERYRQLAEKTDPEQTPGLFICWVGKIYHPQIMGW